MTKLQEHAPMIPELEEGFNPSARRALDISSLSSQIAKRAVDIFMRGASGYGDADRAAKQTGRVAGTLAAFAPANLPRAAFDAVLLMPLADQLRRGDRHPKRYAAASNGLESYFEGEASSRKLGGYVGTLLGDIPHLESFAHSYADPQRITCAQNLALFDKNAAIPRDAWLNVTAGIDMPGMTDLYGRTNVEAQLAEAARMLDRVAHDPDNDPKFFATVNDAETSSLFLEAAGLHAFGMQLDSAINKARVAKSGNNEMLEFASEKLEHAKSIPTEYILEQFFGKKPQEHSFRTDGQALYDESIIFSSTPMSELGDSDREGVLHSRFKSVGKYAMKLLTNADYSFEDLRLPCDVFGMYAVLPDEKQLGTAFAETVVRMIENDLIEPTIAPSKTKPLNIQGSPEFIRKVCEQIEAISPEVLKMATIKSPTIKTGQSVFEVAKFNAVLKNPGLDIPVEFQFQTAAGRTSARLGDTSHRGHNAKYRSGVVGHVAGSSGDLTTIYERKLKMTSAGGLVVNERSIAHGAEFRRLYIDSRLWVSNQR